MDIKKYFLRADSDAMSFFRQHSITAVRIALAIIFVWFGFLKTMGMSPATDLVTKTVYWVNPVWFIPFLGWWEVVIGICLLIKQLNRLGLLLMILQMIGTFLPLILLPHITFSSIPFVPSLEGQYIIKNLVLLAAAMTLTRDMKKLSWFYEWIKK